MLITGDITQKGYPAEFAAARDWMRAMPEPVIDLAQRFRRPPRLVQIDDAL